MGIGEEKSFEEYRIYMVSQAKKIDSIPQEMVSNIADFMQLVSQLTREYEELASNSANAAATSYNPDVGWTFLSLMVNSFVAKCKIIILILNMNAVSELLYIITVIKQEKVML